MPFLPVTFLFLNDMNHITYKTQGHFVMSGYGKHTYNYLTNIQIVMSGHGS